MYASLNNKIFDIKFKLSEWGYSSVGRVLLLHGKCHRFKSDYLQGLIKMINFSLIIILNYELFLKN